MTTASERAKAIRDERGCSLFEAVRIVRHEDMARQIREATTVEDLKPILLELLHHQTG